MSPKLSWEIVKNSLVLTVKDGPKTSQYAISRNATPQAIGDILRGVLKELGFQIATITLPPVSVSPVAFPMEPLVVKAEVPHPEWIERDRAETELSSEILGLQQTEGESLEELKLRAWRMAQRHAKFAESEEVAEAAMGPTPEYKGAGSIPNVGVTGGVPVGTTIDGTSMTVSDYREKPRFNIENHED